MFEDFRLKVFAAVAQFGSFTKAAEHLGISQAAVSKNISELEKSTGLILFQRLRREVRLTDAGKVMLKQADQINGAYDRVRLMFTRVKPVTLKLSVSDELYSYMISPLIEEFRTVHPELQIERVMFDDADLVLKAEPVPESLWDMRADSIARIRLGVSPAQKRIGDFKTAQERFLYFDLLYQPSLSFGATRLCTLLKDFLESSL